MKIKVMLVSKLYSSINTMKNLIQDEEIAIISEESTGSAVLEVIESLSPDIVIMTLGLIDKDTLNLAERVILHKPSTHVILVAEHLDLDVLQSAISIGAHNILEFPKLSKEFGDYIKTVYHNETLRLNSLKGKETLSWKSRVISVFGAKGGIGKTTIAVNLAVRLAQRHKKVALIDLDLQFGDVYLFLDIDPKETLAELVQEDMDSDIDLVRSFMSVHSSGVHVLCSPKSPIYAETISAEKVRNLLNLLRSYYDYVIIDNQPFFDDVTITALESSSNIIFVAGLDISIVKNSKLSISILDSLRLSEKILLAVNRDDAGAITVRDVSRALNQKVWHKLPSDHKTALASLNRGVPFVLTTPSSKLTQGIDLMTASLLEGEEGEKSSKAISKDKERISGALGKFKKKLATKIIKQA